MESPLQLYRRATDLQRLQLIRLFNSREGIRTDDKEFAAIAAAAVTGYAAGKINELDYRSILAECADPEGFDFAQWYATYQPQNDIDEEPLQ